MTDYENEIETIRGLSASSCQDAKSTIFSQPPLFRTQGTTPISRTASGIMGAKLFAGAS